MSIRSALAGAIDRTIDVFAPRKGLERKAARKANEEFGQVFRGAQRNRITNNWTVSSGSADYDLLPDLEILRERSRELLRNDPHAASVIGSFVENVVGTGIKPQSAVDAESLGISEEQAATIRRECERAWERWVPHADVARRMNFNDILTSTMRSIVVNGEALLLPVRVDWPGSRYSLAMEVIEPDRLQAPGDMDDPNGTFNRRSGVELGRYGNPVAYYIRVSHPGDGTYERRKDRRHRRISAFNNEGQRQILHIGNFTRPGATRGEPMLAPALDTFKALSSWSEAVLVRERVAACFSLFITKDDPYSQAVNAADETTNTQRIQEIEPGTVSYLAPGENVSFGQPSGSTGAGYDQFVMRHLRSIGAAIGMPYELVSKDFSQTNYSSARAALLEARRVFSRWQRLLIDHVCAPMYARVIEEAWLRGDISISDFESAREVLTKSRWIPPTYGWVDPKKEMEAARLAIDTGLSSLAIEAAAQGRDWEQVLEQQAREQELREELNLNVAPATGSEPEEDDEPQ